MKGANDVANSWASSVASRSVSYLGAMCLAAVMEFSGAVGAGARVTDTIRTRIITIDEFSDNAPLLMLGMVCAVIASSLCLTMATKLGMPVSTTHSLMGGIIGFGIATHGTGGVRWVEKGTGLAVLNSGVVQVFMSWILAPFLAGFFSAIIFTITKYLVLLRENPALKGLIFFPAYFAITGSLIVMLLVAKGGSLEIPEKQMPGIIVGVGLSLGALVGIFLVPWLYQTVVRDDRELKWYDIPRGPFLLRRGEVPARPEGSAALLDSEEDPRTSLTLGREKASTDTEAAPQEEEEEEEDHKPPPRKSLVGPRPSGPWHSKKVLFWALKWAFLHGVDQDVVNMQNEKDALSGNIEDMHARAVQYDGKAEHLFKYLQILTASTASFAHGANDVSKYFPLLPI